jgi:DNA-binding response OmpR family regulator
MMQPAEPCGLARSNRILVAEDDDAMRDLLVGWLREEGYEVTACDSGLDLLTQLERSVLSGEIFEFDVVLSDIQMPLCSALDVLDELFGCDGVPPTILITAFGDRRTHAVSRDLGAALVLEKPFEKGRLMAEIERLRARDSDLANPDGRRGASRP